MSQKNLLMGLRKELNQVIINSYDSDFQEKRDGLYKMHIEFQQLEKRRQRKWKKLGNIKYKHNLQVAAPVTSKRSTTRTSNAFEDGKKLFNTDLSKTGTEGNYLLLELDTLKGLRVDEKQITFDRRKGKRKQSYAETLTGNSIGRRKNPTVIENQINTLSNFNDDKLLDDKVSTTPERAEETYSTKFYDTCVTSEKNSKKSNSNKEKTKLKSAGILECTDEKFEINKSSADTFKSLSNLNFSRIFSGSLGRRAT